jgi:hypothetical protein
MNKLQQQIIDQIARLGRAKITDLDVKYNAARPVLNELETAGILKVVAIKKLNFGNSSTKTYSLSEKGECLANYQLKAVNVLRLFTPRIDAFGALNKHHPRYDAKNKIYPHRLL